MEGNMMNVAFVPGIIPASNTRDVAAGIGEVCEVPVTHDRSGYSDAESMSNNPQQRIPVNIQDSSGSSIRIVLLGKSGVGKSAAGNTILGQRVFESDLSMDSVTTKCTDAHATVSDRSVSVVDAPGFFDTEMEPDKLVTEIARSVYLSSPGPHAFLIVFPVNNRFTEQEQQIPQQIEMMFGEEVLKYSIILFTHGDQLKGKSVVNLIKSNSRLKRLVDQCGGRFNVFNNEDENNREQVIDLLQKIDIMIDQNGGGHYSNQMYEDALRFRQEEEERQREEEERKQEEEKQRQEEIERVRKETEERVRVEITKRERRRKVRKPQKLKREKIEKKNKEASNGFLLFLSKYKRHFCMAAIAAGFVVGGAVGGAVIGGAETGTGAAVGALGGAAVGAAVSGAAAAVSIGAVAKAVGVGVVGGAAVGGAVGGASSGTVKGAVKGALAGAVVGGAAVVGAAVGAALSGAVGGAVAGVAVGGAVVGGAIRGSVAGAVEGGAAVGGAVFAGAAVGGAVVSEAFLGRPVGGDATREVLRTVVALSVVNKFHNCNDHNNNNDHFN